MGVGGALESIGGTSRALKSIGGTGRALKSIVASSGASEPRGWFGGSLDWLGRPKAILLLETGFRSQLLALVFSLETIFDHLRWTRGWHPVYIYNFGCGNAM